MIKNVCKRGHNTSLDCPGSRVRWGKNQSYGLCAQCVKLRSKEYIVKAKVDALTHYGKDGLLRCCWPGCSVEDTDMLSLDHIDNNGSSDRKENSNRSGFRMYSMLRRNGYPDGYQTLCMNHQWKKEPMRKRIGGGLGQ